MCNNEIKTSEESFLLEEFIGANNAHLEIIKQTNLTIRNAYLFFSGLILLLGYTYKNQANHYEIPSIAFVLLPIIGSAVTIHYINIIKNNRRREVWIYNRINQIRKIFLTETTNTFIKEYINSSQGKTTITQYKMQRTEQYQAIYMLVAFFVIWLGLASYFFFTKLLSIDITLSSGIGIVVLLLIIYLTLLYNFGKNNN